MRCLGFTTIGTGNQLLYFFDKFERTGGRRQAVATRRQGPANSAGLPLPGRVTGRLNDGGRRSAAHWCPMTFDEKIILTCIGLGIGLLFFVLSYLNERRALEEVCSFLHRQVLVLPEGARSLEAPYGLDEAYQRCKISKAIPVN